MKTRVGIDTRSLERGPAGVATYVQNLLLRLPLLEGLGNPRPHNNLLWNNLRVPAAQIRRGWALYHAPSYTCPLISNCPIVLAVHDISYLANSEWYPYPVGTFRRAYYTASMRKAARIVVPSSFTAAEIGRIFPALRWKVREVELGVSESFYPDPEMAEVTRCKLGVPERFLLHVGDIHQRRNIELICRAGGTAGLPVVLVGKVLEQSTELINDVIRFEGVSVEELRGLYSAASVFVYASIYEGFGLPLVEAMACGLPVVAVKRSSVPQVCGEAGILVEPELDDLVRGICQALDSKTEIVERGLERAHFFTWDRTAQKTLAVYEELIDG